MVNESENKETKAVAGLLGSLPRVEAPNDFDFRVKARIAAGRPARVSWFPTVVRVAIPLGLVLSVGGYFGYQAVYQPASVEVAAVANTPANSFAQRQPSIEASTPNSPSTLSSDSINAEKMVTKPQSVDDKMVASVSNSQIRTPDPSNASVSDDRRGGSFDISHSDSKKVYPKGVDPRRRVLVTPREFEQPGAISAKDVLTQFGADVVYSGSGWRVADVKDNSAAQKAGLKSGDVVEAINDLPLNEKTSFKGQFSGKSIRLKRDGATVLVDLKKP